MKIAAIREDFLTYFESKQHTIVPSSSLVPGNDPTLLFTNAGMVQFKDVFLGEDKRPYTRATSSQRCVRAGGKHNDLENVGYTARHHTFFEMLGNFSFGDYFKRDAIHFAWEFLTKELNLPVERLWITVHISDDEAADIWLKDVGVSADRFSRLDEDNFWQMGDTGPCGPSSEIFYDHGADIPGGPPGSENDDLDRYIEIWNLVFMQFERQTDGKLEPLPKPSVDTGMGLERIAAIMQGVHNNYDIDLFQHLLKATMQATETSDAKAQSLRVIADHIRSSSFLISDGVLPSNEGRGYVLRRIIRRAIRHGHKLGQKKPFFHKLVVALVEVMGEAYPELPERQAQITKVLLLEEEQFAKTLDKGMGVLDTALASLTGKEIPGEVAFTLYDTYGFPLDLTADIARERGLTIDNPGYEKAMEAQRVRARAAGNFKVDYTAASLNVAATEFIGYSELAGQGKVLALLRDGESTQSLAEGDDAAVVLDQTPFYAESGGQAGDSGYIDADGMRFEVRDCVKQGTHFLHTGRVLSGSITVGTNVKTSVDNSVRKATELNHSSTHLLHAALRKVLGNHVTQKGSLVDSERLRFDFSHFEGVTTEELQTIETLVNDQIRNNTTVATELCDMETAKARGAMALFGEKYGSGDVRVLSMGNGFSVELCGGTHVKSTGDIGFMRITSESGIAAGVRRIEAVTGATALSLFNRTDKLLENAAAVLKTKPVNFIEKLQNMVSQNRQLEKDLVALKSKLASLSSGDLLTQAQEVNGVKVLALKVEGIDAKSLRDSVDQLKNKLGTAVVILAVVNEGKVSLVSGVTKNTTDRIKAGDLMRHVAEQIGGKGGGRPDMAQGGGTDASALKGALASVLPWVTEKLS